MLPDQKATETQGPKEKTQGQLAEEKAMEEEQHEPATGDPILDQTLTYEMIKTQEEGHELGTHTTQDG